MSDIAPLTLWRPPGELRRKLTEMRAELLSRMQRRGAVEPAHLPLVAGIAAALEALDQSADEAVSVAVDHSGEAIRLVMYCDGTAVAATEIAPTRAIRIAGELLDLAGSKLGAELAAARRKASR